MSPVLSSHSEVSGHGERRASFCRAAEGVGGAVRRISRWIYDRSRNQQPKDTRGTLVREDAGDARLRDPPDAASLPGESHLHTGDQQQRNFFHIDKTWQKRTSEAFQT